jgi:hypothetical protein
MTICGVRRSDGQLHMRFSIGVSRNVLSFTVGANGGWCTAQSFETHPANTNVRHGPCCTSFQFREGTPGASKAPSTAVLLISHHLLRPISAQRVAERNFCLFLRVSRGIEVTIDVHLRRCASLPRITFTTYLGRFDARISKTLVLV